jgi:type I restriction enzyme S subunit
VTFSLRKAASPLTVFLVRCSGLRGRLDAEYNNALLRAPIESLYPTCKLRDLAKSRTGGTPSKSEKSYWAGEIPWASPKDFGPFYLADTEDHISTDAVSDSATTVVPAGSLLVVFRSGVLQHSLPVAVTTRETAINQDLKALIPTGGASAEYLGAYFTIFGNRLLPLITKSGATVQSINTAQFDELRIPVPKPEIQDQIVTALVVALKQHSKLEARARQVLATIDDALFDELGIARKPEPSSTIKNRILRSSFTQLTGRRWDPNHTIHMTRFVAALNGCTHPVLKMKDSISVIQYGISERATSENVGVPMLRMLNLQNGEWSLSDLKYIAMSEAEMKPYLLNRGDILFNRTNSKELVGKCNVFDIDGKFVFASYLMRVSLMVGGKLLPEYVVAYMASSLGRMQIDAVSRQIAGMTNINAEEVGELLIPVPSLRVQKVVSRTVAGLREKARALRDQARSDLESAKRDIQALILGEEAVG